MKEIILDTGSKYLIIRTINSIPVPLDVTSHWTDFYKNVNLEGNWHGPSPFIIPGDIVIVPSPTCEKRVVTSLSVYNPNPGITGTFQILEVDSSTGVETIIVQKTLSTGNTWTLECICSCCGGGGSSPVPGTFGVLASWNGTLIDPNVVQQIDFADCLRAQYDILTPGIAYVDIDMTCLGSGLSITENTVYVMKNGNDSTGQVERFNLPFLTIQAAIQAANVAGGNMTVIVHPGYFKETVKLFDTIDVHMLKGSRIESILVTEHDIVSKVSGHGIIKGEKNIDKGIFIHGDAVKSEIEVECDLIECTATSDVYTYITNLASLSKVKIRVGALRCNPDNKGLELFDVGGDGSSTDAVTGRFIDPEGFLKFYENGGGELYRHDSEIVRRDDTNFDLNQCQSSSVGKVYIDKVFVKMHICNRNNTRLFRARGAGSVLALNDFILDLYPEDDCGGSKNFVLYSQDKGVINLYGLTQINCNKSFDLCLEGNHGDKTCNIYGRLLTNKEVQENILSFYVFQGVKTYHKASLPIIPDMPLYLGYSQS